MPLEAQVGEPELFGYEAYPICEVSLAPRFAKAMRGRQAFVFTPYANEVRRSGRIWNRYQIVIGEYQIIEKRN